MSDVEAQLWEGLERDLKDCSSVLELGAMFADKLMKAPGPVRIAVEPWQPYIQEGMCRYGRHRLVYIQATAHQAVKLFQPRTFDAVILIDFIEHLERDKALEIIEASKTLACKRVVVFTPQGLHPQTEDATGYGAHDWQTHRSTWETRDLERLGFQVSIFKRFHQRKNPTAPHALYGVYEKCLS